MFEAVQNINNSIVSMDVMLPSIVWGWMITLNMWAKSIATGVILVGAYLMARYQKDDLIGIKNIVPIVAFIFLHIFLLFTLLDLHQPFRMINIFLHPHFSSAITVGAWLATALTGVIVFMSYLVYFKKDLDTPLYSRLMQVATLLAIPVTLYTAVIMGEASARELWQTPAELIQMALAALLAGSATLILFSSSWSLEVRRDLGIILATATFLSFIIYMGDYFFSWKLAEAEATMSFVHVGGEYHSMFWTGQTIGLALPSLLAFLATKNVSNRLLRVAAVLSILGLYITKHVWLIIPQLLPLS
jgi:formate-dependent nitrite reductase membrane component NrfD